MQWPWIDISRLGIPAATVGVALLLGCAPSAQPAQPSGQPGAEKPAAAQPKYGGTLLLLSGDVPSFDLHQEATLSVTQQAGPSYDNLIRFDPKDPNDTTIIPDLAEKWTVSPDGKSYTFTLRKGVKFQNGNPFTAADVKFTIERVMNPPQGVFSPRKASFEPVAAVQTPDDFTVVIQLKRPYASLLPALAQGWMAVYSKKWVEEKGQEGPKKEVMGTGPFLFKKYVRGTEVTVERNPDYWNKPKPYLDGIKHFVVADIGTQLAAFRTGQAHIYLPTPGYFETFKKEFGDRMVFEERGGLRWGAFHMNATRKPYDNPKVREALNLAISRQDAVKVVREGVALIGGYMRPGGPWSLSEEEVLKLPGYGKDKTQDLARAKQLLAEAGFPNGFDAVIKTSTGQAMADHTIFIIDQLKKIGVRATMRQLQSAEIYDAENGGDFDLATRTRMAANADDPDSIYSENYLCNAQRNWSKLCVPEVDELFMRQSQEMDPVKRKELVLQMERIAVPRAIKIVSDWEMVQAANWSFVKGYTHHIRISNSQRYDQVWLDK